MIKQINEFPLDELKSFFPNGNDRFVESTASLRLSWFPEVPDFLDEINSNYSVSLDKNINILKEFNEEIEAILKILEKYEMKPELSKWQKVDFPSGKKFYIASNTKALAYSIWDWCAVPIRLNNGKIYRIWSPKDIYGSPIIKSLPINYFLRLVSEKTAIDRIHFIKQKKQMKIISTGIGILILVAIIILTFVYKNLF